MNPSTPFEPQAFNAAAGLDVRASSSSAVSWPAIFAGAAAAAALSLILLILGTGLGLSAMSPWADGGTRASTLGVGGILWITMTQVLASGLGGYLAGRLRHRWADTPADEVHFRDTAHGLLAWAVASLVTAGLLTSAIGSILGSGAKAGASLAGGALQQAGVAAQTMAPPPAATSGSGTASSPVDYFVDILFRQPAPPDAAAPVAADGVKALPNRVSGANSASDSAEVARIFLRSAGEGALPPDDLHYVGQLVAERTGLAPAEAEKRVSDAYERLQSTVRDAVTAAKAEADRARKASAYTALWLFVSLLAGAFFASYLATRGGRQRDL